LFPAQTEQIAELPAITHPCFTSAFAILFASTSDHFRYVAVPLRKHFSQKRSALPGKFRINRVEKDSLSTGSLIGLQITCRARFETNKSLAMPSEHENAELPGDRAKVSSAGKRISWVPERLKKAFKLTLNGFQLHFCYENWSK
jgi:hypothetical protein